MYDDVGVILALEIAVRYRLTPVYVQRLVGSISAMVTGNRKDLSISTYCQRTEVNLNNLLVPFDTLLYTVHFLSG